MTNKVKSFSSLLWSVVLLRPWPGVVDNQVTTVVLVHNFSFKNLGVLTTRKLKIPIVMRIDRRGAMLRCGRGGSGQFPMLVLSWVLEPVTYYFSFTRTRILSDFATRNSVGARDFRKVNACFLKVEPARPDSEFQGNSGGTRVFTCLSPRVDRGLANG